MNRDFSLVGGHAAERRSSDDGPDVGGSARRRGRRRHRRRAKLWAVLCLSTWVASAIALDAYGRRSPGRGESYDAIIVLGCRVYADGRPSPALAHRTRKAVELWESGWAPRIVFTGGVGEGGISEASAAAALARRMGVPSDAMALEESSTSTEENARFAAELDDARRVLLVTDAYHVFRSERVFARYFDRVRGVGTVGEPYPRTRGALRESLAVVGYALSGRLGRLGTSTSSTPSMKSNPS